MDNNNNSQLSTVNSQLKKGWEMKTLGELGKPSMCKRVFKNQTSSAGEIPFYKIGTFGKKPNAFISKELYNGYKEKYSFPKKGDILISASGTIGRRVVYDGEPAFFQDSNIVWIDNDENIVLNKYLYLFYGYCDWQPKKGATIPRLYNANLKRIIISYPKSLKEQQQIVAILDKAFTAIDQAKTNAQQNGLNAAALFESYLQNVFENNVSGTQYDALNNICELIVDCEHKTAPKQETGYPSIRTPNIGQGVLILEGVNRVSEETYRKWTRRAIPIENDLILAREAPAGNIGVIPKNVKVCLGQRTVLIRPKKDKFISKYLAFLILSKKVQKQLLSHSTGATVQHINMKDIRAFKIYNLPTLKEQVKVINGIDGISAETKKLETIYQQKIDDLEELKKSLLQKAFSGQLKVENG